MIPVLVTNEDEYYAINDPLFVETLNMDIKSFGRILRCPAGFMGGSMDRIAPEQDVTLYISKHLIALREKYVQL